MNARLTLLALLSLSLASLSVFAQTPTTGCPNGPVSLGGLEALVSVVWTDVSCVKDDKTNLLKIAECKVYVGYNISHPDSCVAQCRTLQKTEYCSVDLAHAKKK